MQGRETTLGDATASTAPLRLVSHLIVGVACGLIAPWTGFAWPFALLTGMVIGRNQVERAAGTPIPAGASLIRLLAVTGGVLAMLFFGAVIGGLIGFAILALAAFSERIAASASLTDRGLARVFLFVVTMVGWLLVVVVLGAKIDIRIGS